MNLKVIVPTKGREKIFRACAEPFVKSLEYPYLVGIEGGERQEYGEVENAVYSSDGIGQNGAITNLKNQSTDTDLFLKIDDDVRGFTGELNMLIPKFIRAFETHEKLGAIAFPYQQEFYHNQPRVFSHYNARLQTCYMIRAELLGGEGIFDPFEDFCHFIRLRTLGYYTLLSPTTKIKCMPVGTTHGGLNDTPDRDQRSLAALKKIQAYYPKLRIGIKNKPDRPWRYEPDFNQEPLLRKKIIGIK